MSILKKVYSFPEKDVKIQFENAIFQEQQIANWVEVKIAQNYLYACMDAHTHIYTSFTLRDLSLTQWHARIQVPISTKPGVRGKQPPGTEEQVELWTPSETVNNFCKKRVPSLSLPLFTILAQLIPLPWQLMANDGLTKRTRTHANAREQLVSRGTDNGGEKSVLKLILTFAILAIFHTLINF